MSLASLTKSAIDQREVKVVPRLVLFKTKSLFGQTGMPTLPRKKWLTVFSQVQRTKSSPRGKKKGSNGRRKEGREGGKGGRREGKKDIILIVSSQTYSVQSFYKGVQININI